MASRLGRGLGGLIAGGASTSSESQDKETIPVQFAPEVKEGFFCRRVFNPRSGQ